MAKQGNIHFSITADNDDFKKKLAETRQGILDSRKTAEAEGAKIETMVKRASMVAMRFFSVDVIRNFGQQLIEITGKFQTFEAVLTNTLQSPQKAKAAMDMLKDFAATTPFQVDDLTGSFVKLANQGFVPTYAEMVKLGDLASSTGKGFGQLSEAIIDAQTGEFERLKEFGIRASKEGDKVKFTFKEQQTQVDFTASSIRNYILSLGDMKGVAGANAKIAETLTGQYSNLQDAITQMMNEIGQNSEGVLSGVLDGTGYLVENYKEISNVLMDLIIAYGTYRAALITMNAVHSLNNKVLRQAVVEKKLAALAGNQLSSSEAIAAAQTKMLSLAKQGLVKSIKSVGLAMTSNPYTLAAVAIAALGYGIYKLVTAQSAAERAQERFNDTIKENDKAIGSEIHQIDAMFARLKVAKKGTEEYDLAKQAIYSKYGEQLKKLGDEKTALNDIATAYALIIDNAKKAADARAIEKFTKESADTLSEVEVESKDNIIKLLDKKFKGHKGTDGIALSETYYWKIKPVIDGEEKITPEIEKILKLFDEVYYIETGQGASSVQTTNAIKSELTAVSMARTVYNNALNEAQKKWGSNLNQKQSITLPLDPLKATLKELQAELPKATALLNELEKADKKDEDKIASQKEFIKGIKNQMLAREGELRIIKEVREQISLLEKEQENYAPNDTEYLSREKRIEELKKKLPSNKETTPIKGSTAEIDNRISALKKEQQEVVINGEKWKEYQTKINDLENSKGLLTGETEKDYYNAELQQKKQALEAEAALKRSYITDEIELIEFDRDVKLKAIEEERKAYVKLWTDKGIKPEKIDTSFFDKKENVVKNEANNAILSEYKTSLEEKLKEYQGYFEKEKAIKEKYENDETFLNKRNAELGGDDESILSALAVLNEKKQEELDELNIFYASKEEDFMNFCERIADFNVEQLKNTLTEAQQELKKLDGSKDSKAISAVKAKITTTQKKLNKAESETDKAPEKRDLKQWQDLRKTLDDVAGSFKEIGEEIGGVVGESIATAGQMSANILSMVDGIITFSTTGIFTIDKTSSAATKALKTVESASVILAIISAALQVAMKIAELFSKDKELSEETIKSYEVFMDVTDDLIKQQKELLETMTGVQAVMVSDKALDVIQKQVDATRVLGKEYLASAAKKSHTYGKKTWERLSDNRQDLEGVGINFDKLKGSGRAEGLFDLSIQQLKDFRYELPLVWAELDDETRKYLETILDSEEKMKEVIDMRNEALTGMSLDDARSELLDFLNDTEMTMENVAENFEDSMKNAINRIVVNKTLSKGMEDWYTNFTKAMDDGTLTEIEKAQLQKEYEDAYKKATDERDAAYDAAGIKTTTSAEEQSATSQGFETMSQETASELNGSFFSMRNNMSLAKDVLIQLNETAKMMLAKMNNGESLTDTPRLIAVAVGHLEAIQRNTAHLAEMNDRLGKIQTNTARL